MKAIHALAFVTMVFLAGCTAGSSPNTSSTGPLGGTDTPSSRAPETDASQAPDSPSLEQGDGVLEGTVADTELNPVVQANVELRSSSGSLVAAVASDDAGAFRIEKLAAGIYVLQATKDGYKDSPPREVEVADGGVTNVTLTLEVVAARVPYHESVGGVFRVQEIACVYAPTLPARCVSGTGNENTSKVYFIDENVTGPLMGIVADMWWQPTQPPCGSAMRIDVYGPGRHKHSLGDEYRADLEDPSHWTNLDEELSSPVQIFIPRDGDGKAMDAPERVSRNGGAPIQIDGNWSGVPWWYAQPILGTPVDVYCMVQQPVNWWLTFFFVDPAPGPEWTIREP